MPIRPMGADGMETSLIMRLEDPGSVGRMAVPYAHGTMMQEVRGMRQAWDRLPWSQPTAKTWIGYPSTAIRVESRSVEREQRAVLDGDHITMMISGDGVKDLALRQTSK
jgi:hypothetical protein